MPRRRRSCPGSHRTEPVEQSLDPSRGVVNRKRPETVCECETGKDLGHELLIACPLRVLQSPFE